jgi:hypothetical protein
MAGIDFLPGAIVNKIVLRRRVPDKPVANSPF